MITLGLDEARREESRDITYEQGQGWVTVGSTNGLPAVSPTTVNCLSAYWNGVCVISGDIGNLDRHLYRRVGDDDRERATTHPAYKLIHDQPNPYTTAVEFWETITSHAVSWGGGFAEIERDNALRPIALWLITPDQIEPMVEVVTDSRGRIGTRVFYLYKGQKRLKYEDVLHIHGLGFDGVKGYSPVWLGRRSLGLSMAAETFGAALFGNGSWPGLAVSHPKPLSKEAKERMRDSITDRHQGPERAHRVIILDEGMTVSKPLTIPPNDAQFLETRQLQIEEIARWLNLPPHKIKHKVNERPGGNFEASEIDYETTTLLPWTTRIEQECDRKLIAPSQRGTLYTEHNYAKRLKTDTSTRMSSYKTLVDLGAMDAAQVARKENLPAPEGEEALPMTEKVEAVGQLVRAGFDPEESLEAMGLPAIKHLGLTPVTVKEPEPPPAPAPPGPAAEPPPDDRAARVTQVARMALAAALLRYGRREAENARRAAKKGMPRFGEWVEEWYGPDERGVLRDSLRHSLDLAAAGMGVNVDAEAVAEGFAEGYMRRSKDELLALRAKEVDSEVVSVLKRWESARPVQGVEELMAALGAVEGKENAA